VADVGERPSPRHHLWPLDESQAYGPDNFEWRPPVGSPIEAASHAEYMRKWQRHYRDTQPERYQKYEFKRRYGLDFEAYQRLLGAQKGKCAVCGREETRVNRRSGEPHRLAVDHCHDTTDHTYVRGLLCSGCNTGLGMFGESVERLQQAIRYLKKRPPRLL